VSQRTLAAIRRAVPADESRLAQIDRSTWSCWITPAPRWPANHKFFKTDVDPDDVLVAEVDGAAVGYLKLGAPTPLPANRHVLEVKGLAIARACQRRGIGRQLVGAGIDEAAERGVHRLTLRVLATNPAARRLYLSLGFEVEGILRDEFLIEGRYVDDVLMAKATGSLRRSDPSDGAGLRVRGSSYSSISATTFVMCPYRSRPPQSAESRPQFLASR
jgi:ribosomal protein S18 acetylase RimI-like enzyme